MRIYVINESTRLTDAAVEAWFPAMKRFSDQIRSVWRSAEEVMTLGKPPSDDTWQLLIADNSDQAGALGYHDVTATGKPIGKVFVDDSVNDGVSVSSVFSHELAEMIMDPFVQRAEQTGNKRFHALELCDPVEADSYMIGNVEVSNFITPEWFSGAEGKFDWLGLCNSALEIRPGGYAYVWDPTNGWHGLNDKGELVKPEDAPERNRLQLYARDRGE